MTTNVGYLQLDSLLGASFQQTLYDPISKQVLTISAAVHTPSSAQNNKSLSSDSDKKDNAIMIISGKDVMSNSGVNLISSGVVAAGMGIMGWYS